MALTGLFSIPTPTLSVREKAPASQSPMSFLHFLIELKSDPTNPEVKMDLGEAALRERFLVPYENGRPFLVNGRPIEPSDIKRIGVYQSESPFEAFKTQITQERQARARGAMWLLRDITNIDVLQRCDDLSEQFIQGPPGYKSSLAPVSKASITASTVPQASGRRDQIFISYSHKDKKWLERLETHLKPLVRNQSISYWNDTQIKPGSTWRDEIKAALARAKVAVLLVSPDFLASDFIAQQELPPLLKAARSEGVTILWIPLKDSNVQETEINDYQAMIDVKKPLSRQHAGHRDRVLVEISRKIKEAFQA